MSQNSLINYSEVEVDPLEIIERELANKHKNSFSDVDKLRLTRYVFNPGRELDLSRKRNMNMRKVFRARLTPVKTWTPIQESPRRYEENGNITHEAIPIFAGWICEQITDTYARPYCVIEVQEFVGWPEITVNKIQKLLLPQYPSTIPELVKELESVPERMEMHFQELANIGAQLDKDNIFELIASAFEKMLDVAKEAWMIYTELLDTAIMERQNHDSTGKKFFDKADMEIARLLERENDLSYKQPTITEAIEAMATRLVPGKQEVVASVVPPQEPVKQTRPMKRCKHCANDVWLEAIYCQYCHKQIPAAE